jgi:Xaa-Pro aminopeptidase
MILKGKKMRDRYEQVDMYSKEEYARRAALVRSEMAKKGADVLLILDCTKESYDHWLTGKEFLEYVIVPADGDMIGVLLDEIDESGYEDITDAVDFKRYVHQKAFTPSADGVRFIHPVSEDGIAKLIAAFGGKKLGIINPGFMTWALQEALKRQLPELEYTDLTMEVDSQKTRKSEEELECIRMAGAAQSQMMEALEHMLRPGRHLKEIRTEVRDQIVSMGASGFLHCMLINLGNQMEIAPPFDPYSDDVIIREGDRFFALYESNSYGGHCTAMGRVFILGKATEEYKQAIRFAVEVNEYAAARMKPGNTLRRIVADTRSYVTLKGHNLKRMCWMHGLSTATYGEQFGVNDISYDWPLTDGAVLHCHPISNRFMPWLGGGVWEEAWELNTYVVTPEGGKSLVKYPLGLTEIDLD